MKIVILTGAGISAESGIPTFRGNGGLWKEHKVEEVCSAEIFRSKPEIGLQFYNDRKREAKEAEPNAAHYALTKLQKHHEVTIITQNVDDLHERAGSNVLHMHGSLFWKKCTTCEYYSESPEYISMDDKCEKCGHNTVRPHVVCFGEYPLFDEPILNALHTCELFVAIGTSGSVHPAADFVNMVNDRGINTIEINLKKTGNNFKDGVYGKATVVVPEFVENMIKYLCN